LQIDTLSWCVFDWPAFLQKYMGERHLLTNLLYLFAV
jgi:hypothetical protein